MGTARHGWIVLIFGLLLTPGISLLAQTHEWTHIVPVETATSGTGISCIIENLRYPVLDSRDSIRVESFLENSGMTLLWYFASWCWNCNQEIPLLQRMYKKYHAKGFDVLGIGVYSPVKDLKEFRTKYNITFPIVVGPSQIKQLDTRQQTYHYSLRKSVGDQRTWGTPFNLWIVSKNGKNRDMYIAAGEVHPLEFEEFLKQQLH